MKYLLYGCLGLAMAAGAVGIATALWILWNGRPDDDITENDEA